MAKRNPILLYFIILLRKFKGRKSLIIISIAAIVLLPLTIILSTLPQTYKPLYDDFEDGNTYSLEDGETSLDGEWYVNYNGHGKSGVRDDGTGNNVFYMYPATSTLPYESHANFISSAKKFADFKMSINVKTVKQLRQNTPPNPWEVAWVLFRETDAFHYYWFTLKPDGIEFGKKDCNSCTDTYKGQTFLFTDSNPKIQIGEWSNWKISMKGNHVVVSVDGNKIIDYTDANMSPQLASGSIVLYNEDASVYFDDIVVTPFS